MYRPIEKTRQLSPASRQVCTPTGCKAQRRLFRSTGRHKNAGFVETGRATSTGRPESPNPAGLSNILHT
ncbi:MAG: hypothetical protein LBR26_16380 [Prevotella sp.]|jgi:hypothetical protein|nr:hypothetical protein [Prevotella sp.]